MKRVAACAVAGVLVIAAGCSSTVTYVPSGDADAAALPNEPRDAMATSDAARPIENELDGSHPDANVVDANVSDANVVDASVRDANVVDANAPDAKTSCYASDAGRVYLTKAPAARQNKCTLAQRNAMRDACFGAGSTAAACQAWGDEPANTACLRCIVGPVAGDRAEDVPDPAIITTSRTASVNRGACQGLAVGDVVCAKKFTDQAMCIYSTCDSCADDPSWNACLLASSNGACASALAGPICENRLAANQPTADALCGTSADTFEQGYDKVTAYLCGP